VVLVAVNELMERVETEKELSTTAKLLLLPA
jgi:hypothetical protein